MLSDGSLLYRSGQYGYHSHHIPVLRDGFHCFWIFGSAGTVARGRARRHYPMLAV